MNNLNKAKTTHSKTNLYIMTVKIEEDYCKGCGYCIEVCPKQVLKDSNKKNKKGYQIPEVKAPEACIQCKKCVLICPEMAINIEKEENK